MKKKTRLSSEERRGAIIETARRLFSEKGFHGVTTRELAEEAGVSEALIFKHFPSKAAIYDAMMTLCQESETWSEGYKLLELEASISTLAILLHFIGAKVVYRSEETQTIHRLILRSLSEDGEFARVIFKHLESTWISKLNECALAAWKAGDLRDGVEKPVCAGWLTQHLLIMIGLNHTPAESVVNYKLSTNALIEQVVLFCMRGIGVKDEAIKRSYNPKALGLLSSNGNGSHAQK